MFFWWSGVILWCFIVVILCLFIALVTYYASVSAYLAAKAVKLDGSSRPVRAFVEFWKIFFVSPPDEINIGSKTIRWPGVKKINRSLSFAAEKPQTQYKIQAKKKYEVATFLD